MGIPTGYGHEFVLTTGTPIPGAHRLVSGSSQVADVRGEGRGVGALTA
ncbi:MAG: hypothetical protein K6T37_07625 [Acidothermus cellulolyticus]|nr:hypothetical protein [Acidothermus cellulolyticus]